MSFLPSRFKVTGWQDGIYVSTVYKKLHAAKVFAKGLDNAQIHDTIKNANVPVQ